MQGLLDPPRERGRRRRRRGPGEARLAPDEALNRGPHLGRRAPGKVPRVEEALDRRAQLGLSPDLLDGSALAIDVEDPGGHGVLPEIRGAAFDRSRRRRGIRLAVTEDPIQTVAADARQLTHVPLQGRVDVGEQCQVRGNGVALQVLRLVEDDEPREVHVPELFERDDRPGVAMLGERPEETLERLDLPWLDLIDHRQRFLMGHRSSPPCQPRGPRPRWVMTACGEDVLHAASHGTRGSGIDEPVPPAEAVQRHRERTRWVV